MLNKPPLTVKIIACVYILVGAVGFAYHLADFKRQQSFPLDTVLIEIVRLVAIVSGVYMLLGRNWARWLAVAWIAFHVIVSAFHSPAELAMHAVICAIVVFFLFRPTATRYFRVTS